MPEVIDAKPTTPDPSHTSLCSKFALDWDVPGGDYNRNARSRGLWQGCVADGNCPCQAACLADPRCDAWTVIRLKNKFRWAAAQLVRTHGGVFTGERKKLADGGEQTGFPNLHVNVLFRAEGCAPIVAEIQIHHERVLAVSKQDHKLYEVIRAESMADVCRNTAATVSSASCVEK